MKSSRMMAWEAEAGMELSDDPIDEFDESEFPSRRVGRRYEFCPRARRDDGRAACRGIELEDDRIEQFVD